MDRENNREPPPKNIGMKGLCIKGKPPHEKLGLSKSQLGIWDLQVLLHLRVLLSWCLSRMERASLWTTVC